MLPDIRFAIGAVLAGALLIVTAFGLAATVRVAHHRTVSPFEASRVLAYADPIDWSARPNALRRFGDPRGNDSLLERLAAIPPDQTVITPVPTGQPVDREPPSEFKSPEAAPPAEAILALLAVPTETPSAVARDVPVVAAPDVPAVAARDVPVVAAPDVAAVAVRDVPVETPVPTRPVIVVAEIPATQSPEATPAETERVLPERVAALPTPDEAVSKAEPDADPPPAATPPVPTKKPVAKANAAKKKVAKRKAARKRFVVRLPTAITGYPVTSSRRGFAGFEKNFFVD